MDDMPDLAEINAPAEKQCSISGSIGGSKKRNLVLAFDCMCISKRHLQMKRRFGFEDHQFCLDAFSNCCRRATSQYSELCLFIYFFFLVVAFLGGAIDPDCCYCMLDLNFPHFS